MANLIKNTTIEDRVFGKHEREIRAIKLRMLGSDAIRFDISNGSTTAHYLEVQTGATTGQNFIDTNGQGISLQALGSSNPIDGIKLLTDTSHNKPVEIICGGGFSVDSYGNGGGGFNLIAHGTGQSIDIETTSGDVNIYAASGRLMLQGDTFIRLDLLATGKVFVRNHLSASIFEVREDGSIHGLASVGAITWDL